MATATEPRRRRPDPQRPGARDPRTGRERPVGGFELWSWLFMRISGIVLLVLAVGHVMIMHVLGRRRVAHQLRVRRDALGRARSGGRGTGCCWSLALIHGINGLRVIILDYVRPPGARLALNMLFYMLGFILFVLGTVIVFTFDPSKWGVGV